MRRRCQAVPPAGSPAGRRPRGPAADGSARAAPGSDTRRGRSPGPGGWRCPGPAARLDGARGSGGYGAASCRVALPSAAFLTCHVALEAQRLRPVVVGRGALGQQADGLAEPLQGCAHISGFSSRNALQLQVPYLRQQLRREGLLLCAWQKHPSSQHPVSPGSVLTTPSERKQRQPRAPAAGRAPSTPPTGRTQRQSEATSASPSCGMSSSSSSPGTSPKGVLGLKMVCSTALSLAVAMAQ